MTFYQLSSHSAISMWSTLYNLMNKLEMNELYAVVLSHRNIQEKYPNTWNWMWKVHILCTWHTTPKMCSPPQYALTQRNKCTMTIGMTFEVCLPNHIEVGMLIEVQVITYLWYWIFESNMQKIKSRFYQFIVTWIKYFWIILMPWRSAR